MIDESSGANAKVVALPDDLPDGRALVAEGVELGNRTELGVSAFCESQGIQSEAQFKASQAEKGELSWSMVMGLSSVDEQIAGLRYLHELGLSSGMPIHRGLVIPNWLSGIPPELRAGAPEGTSFILEGLEDHVRIAQAAPIQPAYSDWHIGSPYCIENTVHALRAGGSYHGVLSQIVWDMPLFKDDVAEVAENIKAIGVVAAKRDAWQVVDSYLEDGFASHFLDHASSVGYGMLEKYIVDDLCGARYATGVGGLINDVFTKVTVTLALYEALKAEHPCLSYVFGNTIGPSDTHVVQNFGVVATEYAVFGAAERRYRTGVSLLPIPITEKVQVPTREGIGDARLVAGRAAEESRGLDRFIDWSVVEAQRDVLVENGRRFFENALRLLEDCGVDLRDPLQIFLALRRIGPGTLEVLCHPGERDDSMPKGLVPFVPTELLIMTEEFIGMELEQIRSQGIDSVVKGRRFVVASADTHWFGSYTVKSVLGQLGAEVVDVGADQDPEQVVAAAEREGWPSICVSMHNGQCLAYGQRVATLLAQAGASPHVFFGGKLNGILEGDMEPTDMSSRLRDLGLHPCVTVAELVEQIAANR